MVGAGLPASDQSSRALAIGKIASVIVLIGAVRACTAILARIWTFTADDAFISLRFVKNALAGHGLVWNPGEYVEGYSNPLWVLMLWAGGAWTPVDLVELSKLLGVLAFGASIAGAIGFARLKLDWPGLCVLAAILVTQWSLVYYAISGMETILYTALVAWLGVCLRTDEWPWWRMVAAGVLLGLLILSRPEGVLFTVLVCPLLLASRAKGAKAAAVVAGLIAAVTLAGLLTARHRYYGGWVPNTYYVKAPSGGQGESPMYRLLIGGIDEICDFLLWNGHVLFALAAIYAARQFHRSLPVWLVAIAVPLFFTKYAGGDWMLGYRFLLPAAPIFLAAALVGLHSCCTRLVGAWTPAVVAAVGAAVCVTNSYGMLSFIRDREQTPQFIMTSKDMIPVGDWLKSHYSPTDSVVAHRIGAVGYYSEMVVIDTWGLCDRAFAQMVYHRRKSRDKEAYLATRRPRLILSPRMTNGPDNVPDEKSEAGGRYRLVRRFRQGNEEEWVLYERIPEQQP